MSQVAAAYAQGLYDLSKEEGLEETVLQQLNVLEEAFSQEPAYLKLLASPAVSKEELCGLLDEAFRDQVHPYVLNFLKLLTEKGHIRNLPQCCKAFGAQYDVDHGILRVRALTAFALTQPQLARLKQTLENRTGKTVYVQNVLDPRVLGGVRLEYAGLSVDATVENQLERIGRLLQNTTL